MTFPPCKATPTHNFGRQYISSFHELVCWGKILTVNLYFIGKSHGFEDLPLCKPIHWTYQLPIQSPFSYGFLWNHHFPIVFPMVFLRLWLPAKPLLTWEKLDHRIEISIAPFGLGSVDSVVVAGYAWEVRWFSGRGRGGHPFEKLVWKLEELGYSIEIINISG